MRSPGRRLSRGTCSRAGASPRPCRCRPRPRWTAALEAADDARHELALLVLVRVEHVLALGLADALDDHLLGGLRGDAAEAVLAELQRVDLGVVLRLLLRPLLVGVEVEDLEQELVADLRLETGAVGLLEADLAVLRLHPSTT
jgi:hypothetical protein